MAACVVIIQADLKPKNTPLPDPFFFFIFRGFGFFFLMWC